MATVQKLQFRLKTLFVVVTGVAPLCALAKMSPQLAVLAACLAVTLAWLAVAWNMGDFMPAASPASRT